MKRLSDLRLLPWTRLTFVGAAMMAAIVIAHALAPTPVPIERVRGSAFSAATIDVSTVTDRRDTVVERTAIEPPRPRGTSTEPHPPEMLGRPRPAARDFAARAPPVRGLLSTIVPNGPPAA